MFYNGTTYAMLVLFYFSIFYWYVLCKKFHTKCVIPFSYIPIDFDLIDLLCLTPPSAIFQLYHGDQF